MHLLTLQSAIYAFAYSPTHSSGPPCIFRLTKVDPTQNLSGTLNACISQVQCAVYWYVACMWVQYTVLYQSITLNFRVIIDWPKIAGFRLLSPANPPSPSNHWLHCVCFFNACQMHCCNFWCKPVCNVHFYPNFLCCTELCLTTLCYDCGLVFSLMGALRALISSFSQNCIRTKND